MDEGLYIHGNRRWEGSISEFLHTLYLLDIIMRVFMKKTSYQMSINRGRMTTSEGAHARLVGILLFLIFLSW